MLRVCWQNDRILKSFVLTCSQQARCGYAIIIMALYWCTECMPLAVTALLPVILFPMMGIMKADEVLSPSLLCFHPSEPSLQDFVEKPYLLQQMCARSYCRSALSIWKTLTCCSLVDSWWPSQWRPGTFINASLSESCCWLVSVHHCKRISEAISAR